jgi:predicted nucleic acid-binding Zn ribbon protein
MSSKRTKSEFVHIGPIMKRLLKECEATGGNELRRINDVWTRVVAPAVAANARPAAIRHTTLLVHVTSSPWVHELQFLKKDILGRLNAELTGTAEVNELLFKIGPLNG